MDSMRTMTLCQYVILDSLNKRPERTTQELADKLAPILGDGDSKKLLKGTYSRCRSLRNSQFLDSGLQEKGRHLAYWWLTDRGEDLMKETGLSLRPAAV